MFTKIELILKKIGWFLRSFVHPFLAPLFTILNYFGFMKVIERDSGWAWLLLIVTIVYFVVTFCFALYQVYHHIFVKPLALP